MPLHTDLMPLAVRSNMGASAVMGTMFSGLWEASVGSARREQLVKKRAIKGLMISGLWEAPVGGAHRKQQVGVTRTGWGGEKVVESK